MSQSEYFINPELMEEMVRLNRQAALVTGEMGGALPEQANPAAFRHILDLACGPGEWVMQASRSYPSLQRVVGVDKSRRMIEYANAQAEADDERAVMFRVMDITQLLDFEDASFDLVNGRFLLSFMKREQWPLLIKECRRILKPGGILRVTEQESGFSNNLIYQKYIDLWGTAWMKSGHSFAHSHAYIGVTVMLKQMMHQAGLSDLRHQPISIDLSTGMAIHQEMIHNLTEALKLASPFLIKVGAGTQREINALYKQMESLKGAEDFCAYWFLQTIWGSKSHTEEP